MQAHKKLKIRRQSTSAAIASNDDCAHSLFQTDRLEGMPISKRTLNPFSVHYSLSSSCWIATITYESHGESRNKTTCFNLSSEGEAKKFCLAYSKPKQLPTSSQCFICKDDFTAKLRPCHCRNCGVCICEKCTTRWGARMIPKTYVSHAFHTVRVCTSCDWLSNAFCLALLQGRYNDAIMIFGSGNVNLRSTFAAIRGESMFPVHCCTLGGNVKLLQWLVDRQLCPLSVKRDPKSGNMLSLKTSSDRTLIDLAMVGKHTKVDVLAFLIQKGLSISDLAEPNLAGRTLEALLKSGFMSEGLQQTLTNKALVIVDPSERDSCATVENLVSLPNFWQSCCRHVSAHASHFLFLGFETCFLLVQSLL